MKRILVVGAADTKGEELAYLRSMIAEAGRRADSRRRRNRQTEMRRRYQPPLAQLPQFVWVRIFGAVLRCGD